MDAMTYEELMRMYAMAQTMPREAFQVDYGAPASGTYDPRAEGWTSYHTLPQAAGMLGEVWYDRLVGEPLQAMSRVGAALQGKTNPDRVAFQKDVLDALSLYSGPGILAGKPTMTMASAFGGVRAKGANLRMREVAERAIASGKDQDEVWRVTGWRTGAEGKWRFEIDDSKMTLGSRFADVAEMKDAIRRPGGEYLGDVIQHPELFKQYPELNDVRVSTFYREPGGSNAVFDGKNISLAHNMTPEQAKGAILHEVQHWIQKKEDFARGANTDQMSWVPASQRPVLMEEAQRLYREWKPAPYEEFWGGSEATKEGQKAYNAYLKRFNSKEGQEGRWRAAQEAAPERVYLRNAGEIEARDVSDRRTWDAAMRRKVPPTTRSDAIVRMGNPDLDEFVKQVATELNY
jgi:hypothetical protein